MIVQNTQYVKLDDINIFYYDNQNFAKPVIIFLHGLGESLESWQYQLDHFNLDYRVIALDLRGHGKTGDGSKNITMRQFAHDILELLNILKIEKAHFVGLSMGGMICQELTKLSQERMLSIVLSNTASYNAHPNLSDQIKWVKSVDLNTIAKLSADICLPKIYNQELYKNVVELFSHNRKPAYVEASIATMSIDFRNILANIKVPTLIITGELDLLTPIAMAKFIQDNISNSELFIIPGAGHLSNLEQPHVFNLGVTNFIAKH